jgi:hypothetical protein
MSFVPNSPRIKVNVLGRIFDVSKETLYKIPYFVNGMTDSDIKDEIYVERSPTLFEHVLSYVIDNNYAFPAEHFNELDFYDVKYNTSKFHDSASKKDLHTLATKIDWVDEGIRDILQFTGRGNKGCLKKGCGGNASKFATSCRNHEDICLYRACNYPTDKQYCITHKDLVRQCIEKDCIFDRANIGGYLCFYHTNPTYGLNGH